MFESRIYFIIEGIIALATTIYMIMLYRYNQELAIVQEKYSNNIESSFAIMATPGYFGYLIGGFLFIILLIAYSVKSFKLVSYDFRLVINCLINIVLLIILLIIFSNPVLTTFATVLLVAGLFMSANSS